MQAGSTPAPKRRRVTRGRYAATGSSMGDSTTKPSHMSLRSGKKIGTRAADTEEPPERDIFPMFTKLPTELRVYIWQLAAEDAMQPFHPLRVRLYKGSERVYNNDSKQSYRMKTVLRLAAMPDLPRATRSRRSLLQVSREARLEVRRLWDSSVTLERGKMLYFSHAHDLVYLDIVNLSVIGELRRLNDAKNPPEFASAIGHIGFDMVPNYPLWMTNTYEDLQPTTEFILCFPRLHSVSLVHYKAFSPEIEWSIHRDVKWLLTRSHRHGIRLRSFPALTDFNYSQQGTIGNRQPLPLIRHECTFCTIHKCVFMSDLLQNKQPPLATPTGLSAKQIKWLANLKRNTLVAATKEVDKYVRPYRNGSLGWWAKRPHARCRGFHEDEEDGEDSKNPNNLSSDSDSSDFDDDGEEDDLMDAFDSEIDEHAFELDDDESEDGVGLLGDFDDSLDDGDDDDDDDDELDMYG